MALERDPPHLGDIGDTDASIREDPDRVYEKERLNHEH